MAGNTGGTRLSGDWRQVIDALDGGRFENRLARALAIAGARVGQRFTRDARKLIRAGDYAPNSEITKAIKGSSKPLVDGGDLFQAITFTQPSPYELRLGVMRAASGDKLVNLGLVLHEGATLVPTPAMRRAVFAKLRANATKSRLAALGPRARGTAKAVWVIPARPFLARPAGTSAFRDFVGATYSEAVKAALVGS